MIFNVSLARNFGVIEFGKLSFAIALTSLFSVIIDPGFNQLIIREVARDKKLAKKFMSNILIIKLFLSFAFLALVFGVVNLLHYPLDTKIIVYIFGFFTILTSFGKIFRAIFHAFEKMEYDSFLTIIEKIIIVSLGMFLLILGYDLIHVVFVYIIGGIINVMLSLILTVKKFEKPELNMDFSFWKQSTIAAIPFGLTMIFVTIFSRIDTIMLSIMTSDAPVGWYNAAFMIISALMVIPGILFSSIFPLLSKYYISSFNSIKMIYKNLFRGRVGAL